MNRFRCLLALLACLVPGTVAHAQVDPMQATTHVTLGQSVVPLYGPWKFTVGDSPVDPSTHSPLWAEPGFDDSRMGNGGPDTEGELLRYYWRI